MPWCRLTASCLEGLEEAAHALDDGGLEKPRLTVLDPSLPLQLRLQQKFEHGREDKRCVSYVVGWRTWWRLGALAFVRVHMHEQSRGKVVVCACELHLDSGLIAEEAVPHKGMCLEGDDLESLLEHEVEQLVGAGEEDEEPQLVVQGGAEHHLPQEPHVQRLDHLQDRAKERAKGGEG